MRTIATKLWATQIRGIGGILKNGISMQLDATSIVDAFTPADFPLEFKDLKIPLYVVATDFQSWHQVVFNSGLLRPAIAGSIAIPSLFKPVVYANHIWSMAGWSTPYRMTKPISTPTSWWVSISMATRPKALPDRSQGARHLVRLGPDHDAFADRAYDGGLSARYLHPAACHHFGRSNSGAFGEIVAHAEMEKERFKRILAEKIEAYIAARSR